jgi:hypothetical protein
LSLKGGMTIRITLKKNETLIEIISISVNSSFKVYLTYSRIKACPDESKIPE